MTFLKSRSLKYALQFQQIKTNPPTQPYLAWVAEGKHDIAI